MAELRAPLLKGEGAANGSSSAASSSGGIPGQGQQRNAMQRSVSAESVGAPLAHEIMGDLDASEPAPEVFKKSPDLGKKDLGYFLSFIFLVNQIYGPGVLAIPIVFKQAGIGPTVFMLVEYPVLSVASLSCFDRAF